jgi:signal transduction histidine kinase
MPANFRSLQKILSSSVSTSGWSMGWKVTAIVMTGIAVASITGFFAATDLMDRLVKLNLDSQTHESLSQSRATIVQLYKNNMRQLATEVETCAEQWNQGQIENISQCQRFPNGPASKGEGLPVVISKVTMTQDLATDASCTSFVNLKSKFIRMWTCPDGLVLLRDSRSPQFEWRVELEGSAVRSTVDRLTETMASRDHLSLIVDQMYASLVMVLAAAAILGGIVAFASMFLMSRSLRMRFNVLRHYIASLKDEHFSSRPALLNQNDELGLLAEDAYTMRLALAKAQAKARQTERLSLWQSMARKVAHEIKNPITPISLVGDQLQLIAQKMPEGLDRRRLEESSRIILEESGSLNRMVKEFTAFARLPKPQLQQVDLKQVVSDFIERNQSCHLMTSPTLDAIPIMADAAMIRQVLHNLVHNAKLSRQNPPVRVDLRIEILPSVVRLYVADNGPGIPETLRSSIFDAYVTTRSTGDQEKGMGLGLTISRQIMHDHQGSIELFSTSPEGTIMCLEFPLCTLAPTTEHHTKEGQDLCSP